MKKKQVGLVIALGVIVAMLVFGGIGENTYSVFGVKQNMAYANSLNDTSKTMVIGTWSNVTVRFYHADSCSVVRKFDYRVLGATSWTAVAAVSADTLLDTSYTALGGYDQIVLRDNVTSRIPGTTTQFRIRNVFAATNNSAFVSKAVFSEKLEYGR